MLPESNFVELYTTFCKHTGAKTNFCCQLASPCPQSVHKALFCEVTIAGYGRTCCSRLKVILFLCMQLLLMLPLNCSARFAKHTSRTCQPCRPICVSLRHCSRHAMPFERYTDFLCDLQAGCLSCNLQSKASGLTCTSCGGWFMSAMLLSLILQSLGATLPVRC